MAKQYKNRLVMIGCGAVGHGVLPLLFGEFGLSPAQVTVISADASGQHVAARLGIRYLVEPLTEENHRIALKRHLAAGDTLLNLSVDVSSVALLAWCQAHDVMYLDTCVEPWRGGYAQGRTPALCTTNAWLRQRALALHAPGAATAVIAHGMNPGLISHLLKEALLALARSKRVPVAACSDWGALSQALGVRTVHIAERDTQDDARPLARGEFANTWSAEGFYSESWLQHAEAGWGSHESELPAGAELLRLGRAPSLRLAQPGALTRLRSWVPSAGEQEGLLVTHHEAISIAELLSCGAYRPTVCYVYHPCPKAQASFGSLRAGHAVSRFRVLAWDEVEGVDEVGVLLIHESGALWHGSTLSAAEARRLAPYNSATSLQVAAGVLGALAWMHDHPRQGVVEAESMDSSQVLAAARPWLGQVSTVETDWRPGNRLAFGDFLADDTLVR